MNLILSCENGIEELAVWEFSGDQFMLMINTSGPSLHRRLERPFIHMAGFELRTSLVYTGQPFTSSPRS